MAAKPVRPRDAASLILYRQRGGQPEILVGRRHAGHSFMPQRWVFPGGRVDPGDARVKPATPLRDDVAERLAQCTPSPSRARALAVAAIRETFEEVGLLLGKPAQAPKDVPKEWLGFLDRGLAPALDELELVMRAITPTYSPKRFDARFFIADADKAEGKLAGSGELEEIQWVTIEEAIALPLADVTEAVVRQVQRALSHPERVKTDPVPLYCYRGRTRVIRGN
ncbi:MAG: NUDIX hydrolase [Alphaproteobacteria bacterium]